MSGSRSSSPNSITEWSKQENKKFEQALAYYGEDTPNRWDKVSSALGGSKSAEEVWYHYLDLVDDVKKIQSRQALALEAPVGRKQTSKDLSKVIQLWLENKRMKRFMYVNSSRLWSKL
ncbi:hypothetical protein EJB05_36484, partial [Eragrostis curvula]